MGALPAYAPLEDFYCVPSEFAEDLSRYGPGGLHPVHLGDLLSTLPGGHGPRYRILHKLGFGGQATVWLGEDLATANKQGVAIKILSAACSGRGLDNEIDILNWLAHKHRDAAHPGSMSIVRLLDHFKLIGPNGGHDVLVFNICFAMKDVELRWTLETRRRFGFQLAQGLAYLHSNGIAHGDLHRANLGVFIRAFESMPAERVLSHLLLRLTPVIPRDSNKYPPPLMPKYTVDSPFSVDPQMAHRLIPFIDEGGMEDLYLQIMDLGEAYRDGDPVPDPNMRALVALSPEILLGDYIMSQVDFAFGARADMWALGCTLFELLLCMRPFPGRDKDEIWCMMCGLAEEHMPERWRGRHVHLDATTVKCLMQENTWPRLRSDILSDPVHRMPESEVEPALALLRQLLVLDPMLRPRAEEIGRNQWLVQGAEGRDGKGREARILEPMHGARMLREKAATVW
ncbi:kinase-like protein [Calocera viscosa TUFC12733]|uniref:Kinase-like protein n=1 Tax=Calocera viscosa (strain TUFC12733) TaxID=1330018 RepID=A0A167Q6W3_CALVF|nr:kinase-like protein [Calocera viscosa TUFC12733]